MYQHITAARKKCT